MYGAPAVRGQETPCWRCAFGRVWATARSRCRTTTHSRSQCQIAKAKATATSTLIPPAERLTACPAAHAPSGAIPSRPKTPYTGCGKTHCCEGYGLSSLRENRKPGRFVVEAPAFMRGKERFSAPGKSLDFDHAL